MSVALPESLQSIDKFLEMLVVERGAAPNTVDSYGRDLRYFSEFNGSDINQANAGDIRKYLNGDDCGRAAAAFGQHTTSKGEVLASLVERRAKEAAWFSGELIPV